MVDGFFFFFVIINVIREGPSNGEIVVSVLRAQDKGRDKKREVVGKATINASLFEGRTTERAVVKIKSRTFTGLEVNLSGHIVDRRVRDLDPFQALKSVCSLSSLFSSLTTNKEKKKRLTNVLVVLFLLFHLHLLRHLLPHFYLLNILLVLCASCPCS